MTDATIQLPDGRTLGYADFGNAGDAPVLWCHGGPGSRLEPKFVAPFASQKGLRVVGIDRPGYGLSTPRPGRAIEACVPDVLAVADAVGADKFYAIGVSTGGAYALASAAIAPDRVLGVVVACGLTDMRDEAARQAMLAATPGLAAMWSAPTRGDAIAAAIDEFGEDGSKMASAAPDELSDNAAFLSALLELVPPMFAWGVEGYADDRIADGAGWTGFEVAAIKCPVIVAHGEKDLIVPAETARVTADLVPGAQLRLFDGDDHFTVVRHVPDLVAEMRGTA